MSYARRMVNEIEEASEIIKSAASTAAQHAHRGRVGALPQQITDLYDLVAAMETFQYLTRDLAKLVKACADDVRTHYCNGHTPDGQPWPENLRDAAGDADQMLSKLRGYLEKTPVRGCHDALAVLHGFLRNLHRAKDSN